MIVGDIFIRQVEHARPDDKIERAAAVISSRSSDMVPICEGKRMVGIVTRDDVLAFLLPSGTDIKKANFEELQKNTSERLNQPLSLIIDKQAIEVTPETSLNEAHDLMERHDLENLPVVDSEKRLIGRVSKIDIFRALVGQKVLFAENAEYPDFLTGTYFNTINWKDRFDHELPDLDKLFKKNGVRTILDIGCGTGQYSIELANLGYSVVGIDRSAKMIEEANQNKLKLRRKSLGDVSFWSKEAEDFLYDFDTKFDAILFMSNSISYNPNSYRFLIKSTANSLTKNGLLIFQVANYNRALTVKKRLLKFNLVKPKNDKVREFAFLEFLDMPFKGKTLLKNFIILVGENKRWKWSGIRSTVMAYTEEDRIKSILENEGFGKIETFGGAFDGKNWDYLMRKPFDAKESDWLNVVASKNK